MEKEEFIGKLITLGILLILISPLFFLPHYLEARSFCKSVNGNYSFAFNGTQYCNKEVIHKYYSNFEKKSYWEFEKNFVGNQKITP